MDVNGEKWVFYSIIVSPAILHKLHHGQVHYFGFGGFLDAGNTYIFANPTEE